MKYNFDEIIDRRNTNAIKYERAGDLLPLWVADMDFMAPREVTRALMKTVEHSVFGYTEVFGDGYFDSIKNWFSKKFNYEPKKEWLVKSPTVVFALAMAIRAFTNEGDSVLIQTPVYHLFKQTIISNKRNLVDSALVYKEGRYTINFEDFEDKIAKNKVKLFLLCSPHNPVARVWTKEELDTMGRICAKYNCLIVSDEIHCDFVYDGHKHHVFSTLHDRAILLTSPTKTFNLAGLHVSNIFIEDERQRSKFEEEINKTGYSQLNTMGLVACQSAYEYGEEWLEELLNYLSGSIGYMKKFIAENMPQIKMIEPEGTYLMWLDFKALNLTQQQLDNKITKEAKLFLGSGTAFGESGEGFQRVNIACPRKILEEAMVKISSVV